MWPETARKFLFKRSELTNVRPNAIDPAVTSLIIVSLRERIIKSGLLLFRATSPDVAPIATARTHWAARDQNEIFLFQMLPVRPTAPDTCRLADYKGINGKQLDFSGRATPHSRGRSSRAHPEIRLPHEGAVQAEDDTADFAAAHYPATFPVTSVCRQFLRNIIVSARLYNFGRIYLMDQKKERTSLIYFPFQFHQFWSKQRINKKSITSIFIDTENHISYIYFLLKFTNFEINNGSSKSITSIFIDIGIEESLSVCSQFFVRCKITLIALSCAAVSRRCANCHAIHIRQDCGRGVQLHAVLPSLS